MGYQHWRYSKDAMQTGWLEIDVKDSSVKSCENGNAGMGRYTEEISADGDLKALCFHSASRADLSMALISQNLRN